MVSSDAPGKECKAISLQYIFKVNYSCCGLSQRFDTNLYLSNLTWGQEH